MVGYQELAAEYIQNTRGVINSVDMLRAAVSGGDPGDTRFAAELVTRAADSYAGSTANYEKLGFDSIAVTPATDLRKRGQVAEDLLIGALTDIAVANALIVAGRVAGETDEPASLEDLDEVRNQLNSLTNQVALPLGREIETRGEAARFGFDEVPSVAPPMASPDLPTAKANYEKAVRDVLQALVAETNKLLQAAFKRVEKLDDEEMSKAIGMVGETAGKLPMLGKMITKGLEIAMRALAKLTKLLGPENVEALQEKAKEIIGKIKEGGEPLENFLKFSFGVAETKEQVRDLLDKTSAGVAQIDSGTKRLADLQSRSSEVMAALTRGVNGLNTGNMFVGMFLPKATGVLLFGAFYLVAMDCSVLTGMDFADTTKIMNFVEGVRQISAKTLA